MATGDDVEELTDLLRQAGAMPTFDPGRNITHPCTFCGTRDEPRMLYNLGTYFNGRTITRPVCEQCGALAHALCNVVVER